MPKISNRHFLSHEITGDLDMHLQLAGSAFVASYSFEFSYSNSQERVWNKIPVSTWNKISVSLTL